jgi:hypothetical protein
MDKDQIPESWRRWSRPPEESPSPILRSGASVEDGSDSAEWTLAEPESAGEPPETVDPAPTPNVALDAIREALESPQPDHRDNPIWTPDPPLPSRGINYGIQSMNAGTYPDDGSPLEWLTDPMRNGRRSRHQPEVHIVTEEAGQVADWLATAMDPDRTQRWRTVLDASMETQGVWTTCLRHVLFDGQVCVCLRAAGHEENGDEYSEPFHMDHHAGVAWTSPYNVWKVQEPDGLRRFMDWLHTASLDPLSLITGTLSGITAAVLVFLAALWIFL